ncbi:MAG: 23S rRNA (adenine(2503)-C(2))-methyltransferase RlmN [Candidatus Limnocylindrales bacterium]
MSGSASDGGPDVSASPESPPADDSRVGGARPRTPGPDARPPGAGLRAPRAVHRARARDPRPGLSGIPPEQLVAWLAEGGQPAYRARQIADWLWRGHASQAATLRTLPAALRTALEAAFQPDTLVETTTRLADDGLTEKALHRLEDGQLIESVLMRYPGSPGRRERATICVSSQAGCAVGCPFCATGELGFGRDLDVAEIVDQVRYWARRLATDGRHVTNVVFMGMGEPLLNLDVVIEAAGVLTDPRRFGLGGRHIAISTSGVTPGIERLAALRPPWTLAVSLHAARTPLRDVLVPLNRRYPVEEVVRAATDYSVATGRRISYEYVMIDGINDTPADAAAAVALLHGRLAHVNLIPMNAVAHTQWQPSRPDRLEAFAGRLRASGIPVTIRRNRGEEIGAACGQLAAERAGLPAPAAARRRRQRLEEAGAAAPGGAGR